MTAERIEQNHYVPAVIVSTPMLLILWHLPPLEHQLPSEATAHVGHTVIADLHILKGLPIDEVDDRTHNSGAVEVNPLQQRLKPALVAFTMRVQEDQHATTGCIGPTDPCTDQTLPLPVTQELDLRIR